MLVFWSTRMVYDKIPSRMCLRVFSQFPRCSDVFGFNKTLRPKLKERQASVVPDSVRQAHAPNETHGLCTLKNDCEDPRPIDVQLETD